MKRLFKVTAICVAVMCGAVASACSGGGVKDPTPTPQGKPQLATPANVIVNDEYVLSFDAVENATSYQISIDDGDYIDIGNVTTYNLSEKYGAEVSVRAIGDETKYLSSKEVYTHLDNYSQLFTGFEGAVGVDEWTGAVTGNSAQILGTTTEQKHNGENSLKVFMQNKVPGGNSYGGLMFDTGWYTTNNAIDWANVKTLSVAFYVDTLSDEIATLCETYGSTYNEEIKTVEQITGVDAAGEFYIFYANEEVGEDAKYLGPAYNGVKFDVNKWNVQTVDVSEYATITDVQLLASNSQRAFGISDKWSVASPYCYLLYWDDITVGYDKIYLEQPMNIEYSDGTFTWDEVEYASGYEVSVDKGVNWTRVNKTEYSVNLTEGTEFWVRAVNGKKYADGTARCEASVPAIYHATPRTEVALSGTYSIDLDNANEVLKIANLDGDIESIKIGKYSFLASYDSATGSVKADVASISTGKEYDVRITTSTKVYTLTAKAWDKVISNATELQSLFNIFNAVTVEPNSSANYTKGNFCLDADIDATSVTSTANKAVFVGTLDGQGHVISNLTAPQGGLVKAMTTTGKICNIAFKNCTGTECFIADQFAATLSNVYAEVKITPANGRYGIIRRLKEYNTSDKPSVTNCVFIVNKANGTGSDVGGVVAKCDAAKAITEIFKNVYLINNTESKFISDGTNEKDLSAMTTVKTYTSQTTFVGSSDVTFSAESGWATYWKLENEKLYFGETLVTEALAKKDETLSGTYALDLTNANETLKIASLEGEFESMLVGGNAVTATYDKTNGVIKATITGVTSGKDVTVKITTSTKVYTLTAKAWDKVISNATELQSLFNIFNAVTVEPNSSANYTKGNFCLDADIDATSVTSTANKAVFVGTLDGQGHVISNLTAPQGGLVKAMTTTGKICNIAFKNCTGTECFIADQFAATLSNVYAEVKITPANGRYGIIRRLKEYNTSDKPSVTNCVFIVNKANGTGSDVGGVVAKCDAAKAITEIFKNVYLINNTESKFISDGTNEKDLSAMTTVKTYTSQTTFVGSSDVTFSAESGWATYWKIQGGKLLFNNTQLI